MAEPPVTLQAVHDDGPGNLPPGRVVIHATAPGVGYPRASAAGMAASTARYFQQPSAGGSAHYVVDVAGEQHCGPDAHVLWHAPPNPRSLGIEICAEATYTRAEWLSDEVWPAVMRAAARTAELCTRFSIPVAQVSSAALLAGARGICGHVDVSNAWHQSTHTDPGPGFPWPEFLVAVQAAVSFPEGSMEWSDVVVPDYTKDPAPSMPAAVAIGWAAAHAGLAMTAAQAAESNAAAALALCKTMSADLAAVRAKVGA